MTKRWHPGEGIMRKQIDRSKKRIKKEINYREQQRQKRKETPK